MPIQFLLLKFKQDNSPGNSACAVDALQVFKSTFNALINEDYSIMVDIDKYQCILEH